MPKNLSKIAKQQKIKYFLISFVDFFGVLRSKLVPTRAIDEMQENGAGFAGFATWLDMTPADSDMFAIPDSDSLIQLPWNKEIGWLANQPISLFHGNCIKLSESGIANISLSAGVISNQVAKPANPAPFSCISSIARVGTNFERKTPKKSTKLIKKYFIFCCLAIFDKFFGIIKRL